MYMEVVLGMLQHHPPRFLLFIIIIKERTNERKQKSTKAPWKVVHVLFCLNVFAFVFVKCVVVLHPLKDARRPVNPCDHLNV